MRRRKSRKNRQKIKPQTAKEIKLHPCGLESLNPQLQKAFIHCTQEASLYPIVLVLTFLTGFTAHRPYISSLYNSAAVLSSIIGLLIAFKGLKKATKGRCINTDFAAPLNKHFNSNNPAHILEVTVYAANRTGFLIAASTLLYCLANNAYLLYQANFKETPILRSHYFFIAFTLARIACICFITNKRMNSIRLINNINNSKNIDPKKILDIVTASSSTLARYINPNNKKDTAITAAP